MKIISLASSIKVYIFHALLHEVTLDLNLPWGPNQEVINETSFVVVYINVAVS